MSYITPRRFRTRGLGVELPESNAELGSLLEIASAKADTYCNVPEGHSFLGGTITDEQRLWHVGNAHVRGQRRIWPYHRPLKEVTALSIEVTNGQFVAFDPDNLYLDRSLDVIEVTSLQLTPASVFATGLAPYISLQTPRTKLSYSYGWDLPETERLQVYESTPDFAEFELRHQFIDEVTEVSLNGAATTSGWSADTYEGVLTWDAPLVRGDVLTVSYTHALPLNIALATQIIGADVVAWVAQQASGLNGLSGIRVNEVELRASKTAGFAAVPVSLPAQELLARYMYRGFAA